MAFGNPIVGGQNLAIPGIQSPGFVAGVSGWRIARDGTVEFNGGTFRGSIEAGSLGAQHFWVNNPSTGDVIDVYNSSNKLVFSIDATGRLVATSSVGTTTVVVNGGSLFFEDTTQNPQLPPQEQGLISATQAQLGLFAGVPQNAVGGTQAPFIFLVGQTTSATGWINVQQRGIQGSLMQTCSNNVNGSNNQLINMGSYSGTTDAAGFLFPPHNCGFTPNGCVIVGSTASGTFANLTYGVNGFSSTIMSVNFHVANTGAAYANQAISFYAIFWG